MSVFLATFHTHLSALLSCQALKSAGVEARMAPVPRALSSSCGTCVRYRGQHDHRELLDRDTEAIYQSEGEEYRLLLRWKEPGGEVGG